MPVPAPSFGLRSARHPVLLLLLLLVLLLASAAPAGAARARGPVEDLASYEPTTRCAKAAKPGSTALGAWMVKKYGGTGGATLRACSGGTSEHEDGRAIDWTLDAADPADAARAQAFLDTVLAPDRKGNLAAKARRMGIMYVIWADTMYPAWNGFSPEPYLSSGCPDATQCSPTLRHLDHVHVSLSRAGAKARTSWYVGRVAAREEPEI